MNKLNYDWEALRWRILLYTFIGFTVGIIVGLTIGATGPAPIVDPSTAAVPPDGFVIETNSVSGFFRICDSHAFDICQPGFFNSEKEAVQSAWIWKQNQDDQYKRELTIEARQNSRWPDPDANEKNWKPIKK